MVLNTRLPGLAQLNSTAMVPKDNQGRGRRKLHWTTGLALPEPLAPPAFPVSLEPVIVRAVRWRSSGWFVSAALR
jgi:hypothetical protein